MIFMKILHFSVFYASKGVANYLFSKDIDPNTIHLNDYKFMERIYYITVNILGIKPRVSIQQFFKYGFAEQKMLFCCDTIQAVKSLHKKIRREASLSSSRKSVSRTRQAVERFTQSTVKIGKGSKTLAET